MKAKLPIEFAQLTSPEVSQLAQRGALVLLPFGQVEEHGPHLPVETDALIARELCRRIAEAAASKLPVVVSPVIWSGYSGKAMLKWPGVIRVRSRVVIDLLYDVASSFLQMGFKELVILTSHGHHAGVVRVVVRDLQDAYPEAGLAVINPMALSAPLYSEIRRSAPGGSCHAGEWETSLMLHFGARVDMSKASNVDHLRYQSEFIPADGFSGSKPVFWSTWKIQQSKTGAYGDSTKADAEMGRQLAEVIVERAARFLMEFHEFRARRGGGAE